MELWFSINAYLKYFVKAKGPNAIHSPFVFEFYNEVIRNPYNFYAIQQIEEVRLKLIENKKRIDFQSIGSKKERVETTISAVAKKSLLPAEKAVFLFQLAYWLKPGKILELGTCLGISTAYLAKAHPSDLVTFEGVEVFANLAEEVWDELQLFDIQIVRGDIDHTLPAFLKKESSQFDLVFVDANHTKEATIHYFEVLKKHVSNSGCIVFDDIYWNQEMADAWKTIKADPGVKVSIDLYHFGIVFFRNESQKENFVLKW